RRGSAAVRPVADIPRCAVDDRVAARLARSLGPEADVRHALRASAVDVLRARAHTCLAAVLRRAVVAVIARGAIVLRWICAHARRLVAGAHVMALIRRGTD